MVTHSIYLVIDLGGDGQPPTYLGGDGHPPSYLGGDGHPPTYRGAHGHLLMKGKSKKDALKMLTPWYGHIPFIRPAKRFFIQKAWKGAEWAKNEYRGEL